MTTFTGASLADGQVASSVGAIYTCPGSTVAFIKQVSFFNNSATPQTVVVSVTRLTSSARKLMQFTLNQNEVGYLVGPGSSIELSAGDTINAVTTTATQVDYFVTGVTAS